MPDLNTSDAQVFEMMIKDYLYSEVDDACALCGCRDREALTDHHIDGNHDHNEYDNRIVLCHNCHCRYHDDKGITRIEIEDRKRHLIVKTLTLYGLNALKIACRKGMVAGTPFLLNHLIDLRMLRHKHDLEIMAESDTNTEVVVTAVYEITELGSSVLTRWFDEAPRP